MPLRLRIPVMMTRRGPDYYTDNCFGSMSWLNPFCYTYLNRDVSRVASSAIESGYPSPPAPVPIAQTTLVPTGGVDVAGNPTYDVVPQTAAENQAANVSQLTSFFSDVSAQNPPGGGSPVLMLVGIAAVVGGVMFLSGRRRGR